MTTMRLENYKDNEPTNDALCVFTNKDGYIFLATQQATGEIEEISGGRIHFRSEIKQYMYVYSDNGMKMFEKDIRETVTVTKRVFQ